MTTTLHVYYLLSLDGQRAALLAGQSAAELQRLDVEPSREWLELPGLFVDESGQARIGIGCYTPRETAAARSDLTPSNTWRIPGPWSVETKFVEAEDGRELLRFAAEAKPGPYKGHDFDRPMTAAELLEWERERLQAVETSRVQSLARVEADRQAYEEARAAAARRRWQRNREQMLTLLERDGANLPPKTRAKLEAYIETGDDTSGFGPEHLLDIARKEINIARNEAKRRRYELERREWIAAHGSAHLRRLEQEGIEHDKSYRDERLAVEAPGYVWGRHLPAFDLRDALNPGPADIDMLDEARKSGAHNVTLRYLRFTNGSRRAGSIRQGLVAAGSFLDEVVIFTGIEHGKEGERSTAGATGNTLHDGIDGAARALARGAKGAIFTARAEDVWPQGDDD